MPNPFPLAYLITFTCYGARLHGDEAGSVDREHNIPGSPYLPPSPARVASERKRAKQTPFLMNSRMRPAVLQTIREVCAHRGWTLFAAHVRTQHVHVVIAAEDVPEKVLHDLKAYASRAAGLQDSQDGARKRWARHGSTRYLWKPEQIGAAIHYVMRKQGSTMAAWQNPERSP